MRTSRIKKSNRSLILSGDILEVYRFEKPVYYNFPAKKVEGSQVNKKSKLESRLKSRSRSRKMVERLIYSNFNQWKGNNNQKFFAKFLTLTFNTPITDVKTANKAFTLFIKRLNYEIFRAKKSVIKYLAVIEFQKKSRRVHYHVVLFNLPYIPRYINLFRKIWGNGYIWIERIKDERGASSYLTKYMTKEYDKRLDGEKSYFCSRGLKRPISLLDEGFIFGVENILQNLKPFRKTFFENEYTGETERLYFDISKQQHLKEQILQKSGKIKYF